MVTASNSIVDWVPLPLEGWEQGWLATAPWKASALLLSESCDASTKVGEEMSISVNKNYPSSRAKSVSSPMAELAFLSENSRNDTRASNNLQETHTNLTVAVLQLSVFPTRRPCKRPGSSQVKQAEGVAWPCLLREPSSSPAPTR